MNHLEQAKHLTKSLDTDEYNYSDWLIPVTHALIAIAEQLEKMNNKSELFSYNQSILNLQEECLHDWTSTSDTSGNYFHCQKCGKREDK